MAEKTTIARPYAQAIFAIAQEQGALAKWSAMLGLTATVVSDPQVVPLIGNPNVTREQIVDLLFGVCGDNLNDTGKNMVRVLADNGRLNVLPEIAALYEVERARAEGTLEAEVISAAELSSAQQQTIAEALKKRLGREVTLEVTIDASLLGGVIIRAGDLVIDNSAKGKLAKLSHRLLG